MDKTSQINIDDDTAVRLQTISELLDLPIERFLDQAKIQPYSDVMELLRLWNKLRTDDDREVALNHLRWMTQDSNP